MRHRVELWQLQNITTQRPKIVPKIWKKQAGYLKGILMNIQMWITFYMSTQDSRYEVFNSKYKVII